MESPQSVGNMALLPLRTQFKGPAPRDGNNFFTVLIRRGVNGLCRSGFFPTSVLQPIIMLFSASDCDIIDEALQYFKANVFFRNYEIKVILWSCCYKVFLKNVITQLLRYIF